MFLIILLTICFLFYCYVKFVRYTYWERRGIYAPKPMFLLGNIKPLIIDQEYGGFVFGRIYNEAKSRKLKHCGFYYGIKPIYIPVDPEILKHIFIKDFNHFMDRGMYVNETADPITGHLFSLEGQKWRNLRTKLSPTFTSGKMKMMFNNIKKCGDEMVRILEDVCDKGTPMDTKDILARFTTDVIGNCAFGIECNSLKNPDTTFRKIGSKVFQTTTIVAIKVIIVSNFSRLAKMLNIKLMRREISDFFIALTNEVVNYREKNDVHRNDFIDLLIRLKNNKNLDDANDQNNEDTNEINKMKTSKTLLTTNEELAAQTFVFFAAGFETSSSTMTFCLYELSRNQEIQDRLRNEIKEILRKTNGEITYESIMNATYLDMVVNETLRKYPTLGFLPRICTERYKIPDSDLVIEKGTKVTIPVYGLHHDPEYYPEPEKFDPERFTDENKLKRPSFTYLPFGEGPRICIGMRFGLIQTKLGLMEILNNFKVTLNSKTEEPFNYVPNSLVFIVKNAVYLNLERLKQD